MSVGWFFRAFDEHMPFKRPTRAYMGDAGYDLFASQDHLVAPGRVACVNTNTRVDLPPGWFAMVQERSSQGRQGLLTLGNVVDEDYAGAVSVHLLNTSKDSFIVHQGDKVGQLVLLPRFIDPEEHLLPRRGAKAFGSSGAR